MINDINLINKGINETWGKAGKCVSNSGGIETRIKELVEAMSSNTRFKIITKYKNKNKTFTFNSDPLRHLMKYCNNEAR